jgi:O-antigen/teichoic acid export membrane protein
LVSGTAGAHLITAAAMPLLSRLFDPAEFGTLAVFAGLIGTVSVAACLRYDVAIALPESDRDASGLLFLGLISAAGFSLITCAFVAVGSDWIARVTERQALREGAWLMPIGIFAAAACSALQNWSIRDRSYGLLARVRVGQSLVGSGIQLGLGLTGTGAIGLLAGNVANAGVAVVYLGFRSAARLRALAHGLGADDLRRLALEYRRFPVYSTWEALANSASIHIPVVLIAAVAPAAEAGYLLLAMYVMQAPMSLIGSAVGQVYLSKAPEAHRRGDLGGLTVDVMSRLAASGIGPLIAVGILAPSTFGAIFGEGWERAGWLVAWMTPWFVMQFLASPVSMSLHVAGRQRAAMILQLCGLLARVAAVWLASRYWSDSVGEAYALSGFLVYSTYLLVVINVVGGSRQQWRKLLTTATRWLLIWAGPAAVLLVALRAWVGPHG